MYPLRLTSSQRLELEQLRLLRGDGSIASSLRGALQTHLDGEALCSRVLEHRRGELTREMLDACIALVPEFARDHVEGTAIGAFELLARLPLLTDAERCAETTLAHWTPAELLAFDWLLELVARLERGSSRRILLERWILDRSDT